MATSETRDGVTFEGYRVRDMPQLSARSLSDQLPERIQRRLEHGRREIHTPFVGLTTNGKVVPDLFSIASTGVSTQPIKDAADRLLASLDATQRREASRPIDSPDWRAWLNPEMYLLRHGLLLEALDATEREHALALVRASLSRRGFDTVRNLMRLNEFLRELTGNSEGLGEWLYFVTIFGTPSMDAPWGWQLDGHHINISCFVLGDQVVLTPTMLGAEPVYGDRPPYEGIHEFEVQRNAGLALMHALSPAQQEQATLFRSMLSKDLPPERYDFGDGRQQAAALRDNVRIPYEGVRADTFTSEQRDALVRLVEAHVGILREGHDRARMDEVARHLDETHFAWMGGSQQSDVFYYKLHSPVLLIEFDHHKGIFLANDEPEPFHIHIVMRTPNGNDYGRDLLRQHYARVPHANGRPAPK